MQATERAIAEHFGGDEWAWLRPALLDCVEWRVSPLRLGLDVPTYGRAKGGLRAVRDAMEADGLFPPRFFTVTELEIVRRRQDKLIALAVAKGIAEDAPLSPDLPACITVAALRKQVFPTLLKPYVGGALEGVWRRLGGRFEQGAWMLPPKRAAGKRKSRARAST